MIHGNPRSNLDLQTPVVQLHYLHETSTCRANRCGFKGSDSDPICKKNTFLSLVFSHHPRKKKHASRTTRARCSAAALGRPSFKHLGGLDPCGATGLRWGIFKGKNGGTWVTSLWIPRSRSRLTAPSMLGDMDPVMRAIEMEEIIGSSSETSDPPTQQTTKSIQKHPNHHHHHQYHGNLTVAMPPPCYKSPPKTFFLTGWH